MQARAPRRQRTLVFKGLVRYGALPENEPTMFSKTLPADQTTSLDRQPVEVSGVCARGV
jgi:hypothetical protein